jgi:hypothetical protein
MESTQPTLDMAGIACLPDEASGGLTRDSLLASGRFALLLCLLAAVAFPELISGSHTFFYRDFGLFGYPLAHYARTSFWRGELPLWNPLNDCGLPFLAQWNTMTLYPLSVFQWLFPLSWSLGIFCLGHLILGGVGMHRLAWHWTGSAKAGALAGLVFAFNGLTLNSLMWPNNIAALGWMPWVVLTVERGTAQGGRKLVYAALIGATQMLTGAPEVILFSWILAALLGAANLASTGSADEPYSGCAWRPLCRGLGRLFLIGVLVGGIAAIQLLPFLDMLWHSNRESMAGTSDWSMPISGWANLVVPLFQTSPCFSEVQFQPNQYWTSSYYIGVSTVALALWAVCVQKHWRVKLLGGTVLVSLVLALGSRGGLYTLLQKFAPGITGLRYPVKFVVLAVFGFPLLAAYGARAAEGCHPLKAPKHWRLLIGIGVSLVLIALALLAWDRMHPLPASDTGKIARSTGIGLVTLALAIVCLKKAPSLPEPRDQTILWGILLLAVWFDGLTHSPRQNPTAPRWIYDSHLVDGFLPTNPRPALGDTRAMLAARTLETLHSTYIPDPQKYYPSRRAALYDNLNLLEGVPKIDGFYSMYVKEEADVEADLYSRTNKFPARLADFLGVAQLSSTTNLFRWDNRPTAQPFFTAGQRPIFADERSTLAALRSESFDPAREVYLPCEAKITLQDVKNSRVLLQPRTIRPQKLELDVKAEEVALLVLAQTYYHPWRCYIDGQPGQIWRANHAFQAIAVPPGTHRVTLRYLDMMLLTGAALCLAALLTCFCLWKVSPRPLS